MMNQATNRRRLFRTIVLMLGLVAMLGIATISASPAHSHLTSSADKCDICFTAHFSAVETPIIAPFHAPDVEEHAALVLAVSAYQALAAAPSFSRGPPPSSL